MKQKFIIVFILLLLVAVLGLLNAATYVQKEKVPDTELAPNRSTFNSGSTGTQAFYTLLAETGRNVARWQTTLDTIASDTRNRPAVFVMIGPFRNELTDVETTELMKWVSAGGTLILIDREPSSDLALTTARWQIGVAPVANPDIFTVDASNQAQMTASTPAHKPVQPSRFSHSVNAVQPSRFASSISLERHAGEGGTGSGTGYGYGGDTGGNYETRAEPYDLSQSGQPAPPPPPPPPAAAPSGSPEQADDEDYAEDESTVPLFEAPLVHLAGGGRNLLVEAPFSQGRVVILSDPYIVSNGGINIVDNARLAINLVTSREGLIVFDEYHHGYGANNNRFFQYFEGTPVIAIGLQLGLIVALFFFSQSRRFARPIPERQHNRLSKLEYVSAMAELQQRTRAYDLAIENIYSDFRRRVCGLIGLDNTVASRAVIAEKVVERIGGDPRELTELMYRCEDVIHGEPIAKKDTVAIVEQLRRIESQLGIRRAGKAA